MILSISVLVLTRIPFAFDWELTCGIAAGLIFILEEFLDWLTSCMEGSPLYVGGGASSSRPVLDFNEPLAPEPEPEQPNRNSSPSGDKKAIPDLNKTPIQAELEETAPEQAAAAEGSTPSSASTSGSTPLEGHPSSETDSEKERFFTPESSDSDKESLIKEKEEEDRVLRGPEKEEWLHKIVQAFQGSLDRFDPRTYESISERDIIAHHLDLNHPGHTKGDMESAYDWVKPWINNSENPGFPLLLDLKFRKYKRNLD